MEILNIDECIEKLTFLIKNKSDFKSIKDTIGKLEIGDNLYLLYNDDDVNKVYENIEKSLLIVAYIKAFGINKNTFYYLLNK